MKIKVKNCMIVFVVIAAIVIVLLISDYLYHGIRATIRINDNSFKLSDDIDCHFGVDNNQMEKVSSKSIKDGIKFKSYAIEKAAYEYTFCLEGNGIRVNPRISFFHQFFAHDRYSVLIELTPNSDGTYRAVVSEKGHVFYECDDIEKDGIAFQIGP